VEEVDRMTREGQQALRRCRSHSPSGHQSEPADLFPDGRAGELHREVGSVLLATFAEVPRDTGDLVSIDVTDVCDPYIRTTSESTRPVASPRDDQG
jgi:hypothetical protein